MSDQSTLENSRWKKTRLLMQRVADIVAGPSSAITDPQGRRQASLLSWFTVAFFITSFTGIISGLVVSESLTLTSGNFGLILVTALLVVIYIVSRTQYYAWGSRLMVAVLALTPGVTLLLDPSYASSFVISLYSYIPLALVLGSGLLTIWEMGILVSGTAIVTAMLPIFYPEIPSEELYTALGPLWTMGVLLMVVTSVRNAVERDRIKNFREVNEELENLRTVLEQRVEERTQELVAASDVGRSLAQVRDLDQLLQESVELIGDRFDLYYAQIYLTDPKGRFLDLSAGTGVVGAELLRKGHRLPIGPSSINGRAASETRSVIVDDTLSSPVYRPNPLLPDTRSEMAVPLMIEERVVGVLDLQSSKSKALSDDNRPVFETLAGQLAVAIDNAALFVSVTQARTQVEQQTKMLTQQGWQEFLDGVNRGERIGYSLDQDQLYTLVNKIPTKEGKNINATSISVAGEAIGLIQLERADGESWTNEEKELIDMVSDQLSVNVENMRLLAQAMHYRNQAEETVRLLTREGWQGYMSENESEDIGFIYDQNRVMPLDNINGITVDEAFKLPLEVQGQAIGELVLEGDQQLDDGAYELISSVVERLSEHVENLRLSEQTQNALAVTESTLNETKTLYDIIAELNAAESYPEILSALWQHTVMKQADQLLFMGVFDKPTDFNEPPQWIYPVAYRCGLEIEISDRYPVSAFEAEPNTVFTDKPVVLENISSDQRLDRVSRTLFEEVFLAKSSIVIPLMLGDQSIGFVQGYFGESTEFPKSEINRLVAVAGQAAIAVQGRLLYEQAQSRAAQEERIREVSAQVFEATDVDTIMRRAVEQVGKKLGMPAFIYLGEGGDIKEVK